MLSKLSTYLKKNKGLVSTALYSIEKGEFGDNKRYAEYRVALYRLLGVKYNYHPMHGLVPSVDIDSFTREQVIAAIDK
jgi:hypothetical protein